MGGLAGPIIGGVAAIIAALLSQQGQEGSPFKGAPIDLKALIPPGFEDAYGMAGQKAMERMQEPRYVAPINPLTMGAANIASQFYQGQPFQMPGLQQYMPGQGGLGMGRGIANPATMPGGGPGRFITNDPGGGMPPPYPGEGGEEDVRRGQFMTDEWGRKIPPPYPGEGGEQDVRSGQFMTDEPWRKIPPGRTPLAGMPQISMPGMPSPIGGAPWMTPELLRLLIPR